MRQSATLISQLEDAIAHGAVERRVDALRHVTDLFLVNEIYFGDDQIEILDQIFLRLVADIEESARADLASRLASRRNAPPLIIQMLAADDAIAVAAPVLTQSPCLEERAIIEIIRTKSQEHLLAISRRQVIGSEVTSELLSRGDDRVVRSTAINPGADISEASYRALFDRSGLNDRLVCDIAARADLPRYLLSELIAKASDVVRAKLEAATPGLAQEIRRTLATVRTQIASKPIAGARDYGEATATVEAMRDAGTLTAERIEQFAVTGRIEEATVALSLLNAIPVDVVEQALSQHRKEMLLFIAKAIELPWSTTKALLLMNVGPNGCSSAQLEQYLQVVERLKTATAKQAIRFFLLHGAKH